MPLYDIGDWKNYIVSHNYRMVFPERFSSSAFANCSRHVVHAFCQSLRRRCEEHLASGEQHKKKQVCVYVMKYVVSFFLAARFLANKCLISKGMTSGLRDRWGPQMTRTTRSKRRSSLSRTRGRSRTANHSHDRVRRAPLCCLVNTLYHR